MKLYSKIGILVAAMLLTGVKAYSQLGLGIIPLSLELRGGSNYSTMNVKNYNTSSRNGWQLGIYGELRLPASFFVRSGLGFTTKGATIQTPSIINDASQTRINAYYLQLPAMLGYKINLIRSVDLKLAAGPYFAQGIGGRTRYSGGNSVGTFRSDGLQRFDSGAVMSAAVQYRMLSLGYEYEHGFVDVAHGDMQAYNRNSFITLGLRFF